MERLNEKRKRRACTNEKYLLCLHLRFVTLFFYVAENLRTISTLTKGEVYLLAGTFHLFSAAIYLFLYLACCYIIYSTDQFICIAVLGQVRLILQEQMCGDANFFGQESGQI